MLVLAKQKDVARPGYGAVSVATAEEENIKNSRIKKTPLNIDVERRLAFYQKFLFENRNFE